MSRDAPAASGEGDALLAAVGDHLEDGLLVIDDGRRIRVANRPARTLARLPDSPAGRLLDETGCDYRLTMLVTACLEAGEAARRELDHPLEERQIEASAFPLEERGRRSALVLLRDVTRLRRLETVRRDFVANVSHELRTPIASIQLLVETLQHGALSDGRDAPDFVAKIGLEVAHMAHMVEELLELSAIESGRLPLRIEPLDPVELAGTVERLRPLADERDLIMSRAVEEGTPPVLGDRARLEQVLRNLVHNAIKFTPPGGRVEVVARRAGGGWAEFSVSDTGVGITPEEAARIFERFWKADRSRERDGEGSGLGLAIARHVVDAHGGAITIRDHGDRPGVTFAVRLPAAG